MARGRMQARGQPVRKLENQDCQRSFRVDTFRNIFWVRETADVVALFCLIRSFKNCPHLDCIDLELRCSETWKFT